MITRMSQHRTVTGGRHALAAAALASLAACGGGDAEAAPGDSAAAAAPAVMTIGPENMAVVVRDTIQSGPAISGTLAPENQATLRAELGGTVLNTYAEQGQRVSQGTVLARIEAGPIRDAALSARSGVTSAQLAFELAERNAQRSAQLLAAGAIAERDAEQTRSAATAARAQLNDARARLTMAQQQLSNATVRAPFAGIVSARDVNAGDVVAPGGAMYTVIDPRGMRLEASVPAAQLSDVRVGAPVTFTVSGYGTRTFQGKVTRVNPVADPGTGQVRIIASIPNAGSVLVGGLFAEGRVATETREAVVAPTTAIDQRGVTPTVVRIKNGRAEKVQIELGLSDEGTDRVEIVRGVQAGDTLLLGQAQGISAGTPVRVRAVSDAPATAAPSTTTPAAATPTPTPRP
jgi:RND family efflux transporter MFP subunit